MKTIKSPKQDLANEKSRIVLLEKKIFKEQVTNTVIQCNVRLNQDSIYNLDELTANLGIETLRLKKINIQLWKGESRFQYAKEIKI